MMIPVLLRNWKLIAGGLALLAFGIYVAVLKGTINGLEHKLEAERQAVAMCRAAVEEQNRAVQKLATEGQARVSANAAALTAVQPAVRALAASAAALRASAVRGGQPCVASDAAKLAWGDL